VEHKTVFVLPIFKEGWFIKTHFETVLFTVTFLHAGRHLPAWARDKCSSTNRGLFHSQNYNFSEESFILIQCTHYSMILQLTVRLSQRVLICDFFQLAAALLSSYSAHFLFLYFQDRPSQSSIPTIFFRAKPNQIFQSSSPIHRYLNREN
jgi:hypothetical protein